MNGAMSAKPFEAMTADEKIQSLKWSIDELMSRTARHNDEMSRLHAEVLYWRRLHAIREGLSNEQLDRLFNTFPSAGLMPRGY